MLPGIASQLNYLHQSLVFSSALEGTQTEMGSPEGDANTVSVELRDEMDWRDHFCSLSFYYIYHWPWIPLSGTPISWVLESALKMDSLDSAPSLSVLPEVNWNQNYAGGMAVETWFPPLLAWGWLLVLVILGQPLFCWPLCLSYSVFLHDSAKVWCIESSLELWESLMLA
jgi:hypothetical protein